MEPIVRIRRAVALAAVMFAAIISAHAIAATSIPASEFAKRPMAWEVTLSPSGEYAAMTVPTDDGSETQLNIVNLATGGTQVLRFARRQHVTDVFWTADDHVVVSRAEMEPLKARPVSTGELYSSDIKGKSPEMIFGWAEDRGTTRGRRKDEGWSQVVQVLDKQPGIALVGFNCWNCGSEPDTVIFRVDTRTGERKEVERGGKLANYEFAEAQLKAA